MPPRHLQDRDSLEGRVQPRSRRKCTWGEGQGQGDGSGWCFVAIEEAVWENEPHPIPPGQAGMEEEVMGKRQVSQAASRLLTWKRLQGP